MLNVRTLILLEIKRVTRIYHEKSKLKYITSSVSVTESILHKVGLKTHQARSSCLHYKLTRRHFAPSQSAVNSPATLLHIVS